MIPRPAFARAPTAPAYLEPCIEMIKKREPIVKAFVALNEASARAAADESTTRWKAGRPPLRHRRHALSASRTCSTTQHRRSDWPAFSRRYNGTSGSREHRRLERFSGAPFTGRSCCIAEVFSPVPVGRRSAEFGLLPPKASFLVAASTSLAA